MSTEIIPQMLTFDEWEEKFRPRVNIFSPNTGFCDENGYGILFDTYGIENLFVQNHIHEKTVWTWIDADKGTYVVNGYHWVNRIGYFVTEVPYEDGSVYDIVVDEYGDHEEESL